MLRILATKTLFLFSLILNPNSKGMKYLVLCFFAGILALPVSGQTISQYFDGADTAAWNSIFVEIDPDTANVWHIGQPQKTIFDSAATVPNAILTDTINPYPKNNVSSFTFKIQPEYFEWGILALQWKQKLAMEAGMDGGIIEFSLDDGFTWQNVFNNPYVYNFYGFDLQNQDTLANGEFAFSGTDESWKDIWLCFDVSFLYIYDSIPFRYTFISDSSDTGQEGWMIDNLMAHITIIHTVNEKPQNEFFSVYPTVTSGLVNIQTVKLDEFHVIEELRVISINGEVVEKMGPVPTKFYLDISKHPEGLYYLLIKTNIQTGVFPVILNK